MARRKKAESALVVLVVLIGLPIWLFENHPVLAVVFIIGFIAMLVLYSLSRTCQVCGVALKRVTYRWQIDGETKRVCPNCNRTLERRQSSHALRNI